MYKNAKATRRITANAAITPPAIAAVLELFLTAPKLGVEDEVWEVNGSLKADVDDGGDDALSKEYVIESRITKDKPTPAPPF